MKIAISQPTYLPWLGYFDLIDQVDRFVILDTVQFEKQSWQQRNRIKTPIGLQWLTVPVIFRGRLGQAIRDVEIRHAEFRRAHLRAIELNYRRTGYFKNYFDQLSSRLTSGSGTRLMDLNVCLIEWLMGVLGIQTQLILASQLNQHGKRTELLANICTTLGARHYISPLGAADYLFAEKEQLLRKNVDLFFQHFEHPRYTQSFPPFCAHASVLDLIFNEGPRSLEIIRTGRRELLLPPEVAPRQTTA
jgi:WbqC-like protein family